MSLNVNTQKQQVCSWVFRPMEVLLHLSPGGEHVLRMRAKLPLRVETLLLEDLFIVELVYLRLRVTHHVEHTRPTNNTPCHTCLNNYNPH